MGDDVTEEMVAIDHSESDREIMTPASGQQTPEERAYLKEMLREKRLALAKDPRNVQLLDELGQAAEAAGDLDRARWAYKRAIRLDAGYADVYRRLGYLDERQGRKEAAIQAFQNYLLYAGHDSDVARVKESLKKLHGQKTEEVADVDDSASIGDDIQDRWDELRLTPGEALYMLDPENSSAYEMLRYTLLDMINRGVLALDEEYGVGRGERYGKEKLQPHEVIFSKYFARFKDLVDIDRLTRSVALQLGNNTDKYKSDHIQRSLISKGYLKAETRRIGGIVPVETFVLTDKGRAVSSQLKWLLKELDVQIARLIKSNPEHVQDLVDRAGPVILLMESLPPNYVKKWSETLDHIMEGLVTSRGKPPASKSSAGSLVEDILKALIGD